MISKARYYKKQIFKHNSIKKVQMKRKTSVCLNHVYKVRCLFYYRKEGVLLLAGFGKLGVVRKHCFIRTGLKK